MLNFLILDEEFSIAKNTHTLSSYKGAVAKPNTEFCTVCTQTPADCTLKRKKTFQGPLAEFYPK